MTITELANELGVSTQAVYKRLQRNNVDVATLKVSGSKELTDEGADTIRLMYKNSPTVNKRTRKVYVDSLSTTSKTGLTQLLADQKEMTTRLEKENEMLKAELAEWKQRYDLLLQSALALRAESNRLTEGKPDGDQTEKPTQKVSWWHRLRKK